jgi:hypothetical protein
MPPANPARARLAPLLLLLVAGCTAPTEVGADGAYVLLDAEARSAGALTLDGWTGAPVLPIEVSPEERVTYQGRGGSFEVPVEAGSLTVLEGRDASPRTLRLGHEVREDALFLHATAEAAAELGRLLGGEVSLGPTGLYRLDAGDALALGSFLEAPNGLLEVEPVPPEVVASLELLAELAPFDDGAPIPLLDAEGQQVGDGGERDAEVVGLYGVDAQVLLLDAAGRATMLDPCGGRPLRTGVFHTRGSRVLVAFGDGTWNLSRAGDALVLPDGQPLFPLLAEPHEP